MFGLNRKSVESFSLLEVYYPRLMAYAYRFTQDSQAAEDLVQDAFYNFLKKYKDCSEEEFPKIIFRITRNRCLDYLKHRKISGEQIPIEKQENELLYNFDFLSDDSADSPYLIDELNQQIEDVLEGLPLRCREVFEMSRFQDMSNKEIADKLGISIKTVKNHMTKALAGFYPLFPKFR